MIHSNGLEVSGKDCAQHRVDLSFIVRFRWKTPDHLKEAIQVLLAARLASLDNVAAVGASGDSKPQELPRQRRIQFLDEQEFEQIRFQLASNPNTPETVLEYLAHSAGDGLLLRIAENSHAPVELLELLANHADPLIRTAVGENPNTPVDVLLKLAADFDPDVRYQLAENPALPDTVLQILQKDENPYVSTRAVRTALRLHGGEVVSVPFGTVCDSRAVSL